jgi:hypothetical protein
MCLRRVHLLAWGCDCIGPSCKSSAPAEGRSWHRSRSSLDWREREDGDEPIVRDRVTHGKGGLVAEYIKCFVVFCYGSRSPGGIR